MKTERGYVEAIVKAALAKGYMISLDNGGAWPIIRCTDFATIMAAMFTVCDETLVFRQFDGSRVGAIYLVYGNAPDEVVNDHSDNMAMYALLDEAGLD